MSILGFLNLRCRIIDISRGGLSFIYNDSGIRMGETAVLDISFKKSSFLMKNLSVKIISDSPVPKRAFFSFGKKRQCGAQFMGLIQQQAEQLEYFIESHNRGET